MSAVRTPLIVVEARSNNDLYERMSVSRTSRERRSSGSAG